MDRHDFCGGATKWGHHCLPDAVGRNVCAGRYRTAGVDDNAEARRPRIVDCPCLELVLGELTTAAESDGQKRTEEDVAEPEEDSPEARCRLASTHARDRPQQRPQRSMTYR